MTSIKGINYRLKVVKEEQQKKRDDEKAKNRCYSRKTPKTIREINLSCEEEENYENDIGDKTNPDQAGNNKNLLQF